jgi:hypothetical protein
MAITSRAIVGIARLILVVLTRLRKRGRLSPARTKSQSYRPFFRQNQIRVGQRLAIAFFHQPHLSHDTSLSAILSAIRAYLQFAP